MSAKYEILSKPENFAWLNIDLEKALTGIHSKLTYGKESPDATVLRLMRNPDNFIFTCKHLLNLELIPLHGAVLKEIWTHSFPMFIASRGFSKSFLLAVFCLLKMALTQKAKIVVVGAGFRQAKVIFEYMEDIWRNAPILRDIASQNSGPRRDVDRCTFRFNDSWTVCIPLGNGEKIRGLRANVIIADEFNSISPLIYETVIAGFTAVSMNPVLNTKAAAKRKYLMERGVWTEHHESLYAAREGNQAILSGTAGFDFEHFADYWKKYHTYITSKGDLNYIKNKLELDSIDPAFDYKDYCIIRIPYELVPEGFMEAKHIARAKASLHVGTYNNEYGAVFSKDSSGFFKRTLIHSCTATDTKPVITPGGSPVWFDADIRGEPTVEHVIGIDPASESDNFTITVLALHQDHRRVVYAWSTNRKDFIARQKAGLTKEGDYYAFCSRKVRNLQKVFNVTRIGIDKLGGGIAILEAWHDVKKLEPGEQLMWEVIDYEKEKDTDTYVGQHIIEIIKFADATWVSEANHGLRKDMEERKLLFPRFDSASIEMALEEDKIAIESGDKSRIYDTLEDCVNEIEEMKRELSTIVMTRTTSQNREHWDTPEIQAANGKKGRMKKDRYSALLIANAVARKLNPTYTPVTQRTVIGGASHILVKAKGGVFSKAEQSVPEWYQGVNPGIYTVIKK
jgi:uncharacterized protein YfbU (UPF0304 family)